MDAVLCVFSLLPSFRKRIWECVQLEIKRRKKSESYLRQEDIAEDEVEII